MRVQQLIEKNLAQGLDPLRLEVTNESHRHNVPPGSESHFKVVLVSDAFAGRSLIQRHRMVHELLADAMRQGIHALALHTYAPQEWRERYGGAPDSPPCLGGGAPKRA